MEEERWTDADDARLTLHSMSDNHPVKLTIAIWEALDDHVAHFELLSAWVTPESLEQWGDFSEAAKSLHGEPLNVLGTIRQFEDAQDVAYVWLIRADPDSRPRMTSGPERVNIFAVFTWVWRPELGGWRLHATGKQLDPDRLPRSAPGQGPALDAVPA